MVGVDASTQDLQQHRSNFAALSNKAYFNYGAQGPLPKQAVSAIFCSYDSIQTNGPFTSSTFDRIKHEIDATKNAVANLLNAESRSIALTQSVTEGCNIVFWGIDWQPGDHLLLSDCEHPSIIAIAERLSARHKVELSFVHIEDATVDVVCTISENLRERTRLVTISHVLWNTGRLIPIADIARICKDRGVKLLVDGAQSAGVMPLDMQALGADFYAITGHKWLCGPEGVGALYIHSALIEQLQPTFVGWRGVRYAPKDGVDATRFESATSPFPLFAGLRAALDLHNEWATIAERYNQIKNNVGYLREKLSAVSGVRFICNEPDSALVTFTMDKSTPSDLASKLESENVIVRAMPHPSCVRVCVHYLTNRSDIDKLVGSLAT